MEFDRTYSGGNYHYPGVGEFVLIPVALADSVGVDKAFETVTRLSHGRIVHWSPDELYEADGKPVTAWSNPFGHPAAVGPGESR